MLDRKIRDVVTSYLKTLRNNGLQVSAGVVFGSQATGKAGQWSDIDLLVISPAFDQMKNRQNINLLWRLAARTDSRIEPIPCREAQWWEDDYSPIIEAARQQGEMITL